MIERQQVMAVVLATLAVGLALSGVAGAAIDADLGTNTTQTTPTPTPTDSGGMLDDATSTVDDTVNDTSDTVDDTTSTVDGTVDSTTDTVNDTVDSTTNTVDSTTDTVDDTVDSTTDTVDDTVDSTTDTVDGTVDSTTDTVDSTTNTTDDTTDTLDNTTSTLTNTTDDTTSTLTDTTDSTTSTLTEGLDETTESLLAGVEDPLDTTTSTLDGGLLEDDASLTDPGDESVFTVSDGSADSSDESQARYETPSNAEFPAAEATTPAAPALNTAPRPFPGGPGPMAVGATAAVGMTAVAAGAMLGGSATGSATGSSVGQTAASRALDGLGRLVRMIVPFRYSSYEGDDPLEHEDRQAIHDYVDENPGAYMSAVSQAVDIPHSTARHHIKILEREGLLENAKVRGRRRLFPAHSQQQELAAAMADDSTAVVLEAIARLGPCSGSALAEEVDKSISTVSHHLSRLADDDLVVREKEGRTTVNRLPSDVQEALAPDTDPLAADAQGVSAD
jgi:DNA-binding transcriptional ArsR family regulator